MGTNKYWVLWTTDSIASTESIETVTWNTVTKFPNSASIVTGSTSQFQKNIWYNVQDTDVEKSSSILTDPNSYEIFSYLTHDPKINSQLSIFPIFGNTFQVAYCENNITISSSVYPNTFYNSTQEKADADAFVYAQSQLHCSSSLIPGLLWQIPPITGPSSTDFGCGQMYYSLAVESSDVSASLPGDSSTLYKFTCLLRGVSEYGSFRGGSYEGPFDNGGYNTPFVYVYSGGVPDSDATPVFGMTISDPPQEFYLNVIPPSPTPNPFCILYLDRTFTFTAYGGADIHLVGTNGDGYEIWNDTGIDHQPYIWSNEPVPMQITQPYNGQFLQMDVLSIDLA